VARKRRRERKAPDKRDERKVRIRVAKGDCGHKAWEVGIIKKGKWETAAKKTSACGER